MDHPLINPDMPRMERELATTIEVAAEIIGIDNYDTEMGQNVAEFLEADKQVRVKVELAEATVPITRTIHSHLPDARSNGGFRLVDHASPIYGDEGTNPDELSGFLASEMALKNFPDTDGAKASGDVEPHLIRQRDFMERLCRKTVRELWNQGYYQTHRMPDGSPSDVWAPDLNTGAYIDAMFEELYELSGDLRFSMASFTGKSVEHGGIAGRVPATGEMAAFLLPLLIEHHPVLRADLYDKPEITYVQQSLGQAGWHMVNGLSRRMPNAQLVGVSEMEGSLIAAAGRTLPVDRILQARLAGVSLKELQGDGLQFTTDTTAIMDREADVLSLAFDKNQVNAANADRSTARLYYPISNGGVDPSAIAPLIARGAVIAPDFNINAGGSKASRMETEQALGSTFTEQQFWDRLERELAQIMFRTLSASDRYNDDSVYGHEMVHNLGLAATVSVIEMVAYAERSNQK